MEIKRIISLIALLAYLGVLTPFRGLAESRAPSAEAPRFSEAMIDPESGGAVELDGARVEIPAGALARKTKIRITALRGVEDLDEGLSNATQGAAGFRFEPHGTVFLMPARVSLPFDRALAGSRAALSNLYSYFYDEEAGRWERLDRIEVDAESCVVLSNTSHFTDMANAALSLPEGPADIEFDPNSIKNLEAADPSSEVAPLNGLAAGPYGDASFEFPLRLPPGRGGAAPSLAFSYSSENGDGWLGRGFDLAIPAITIDTRMGPPEFDGDDRYLLDGEELVRMESAGTVTAFRPRVERSFRRIRHSRGAAEDYWTVTDKDGTTDEYGRGNAWDGRDRSDPSSAFAWRLAKTRDTFGNTVTYHYSWDEADQRCYLESIRYSGREGGDEGIYSLRFENQDRLDRRVDARGGFPSRLSKRLAAARLYYRDEPVRSWTLVYRTDDFGDSLNEMGQSQIESVIEADGNGNEFYRYSFDYETLGRRFEEGRFSGYEGFGEEERWGSSTGDRLKPMRKTATFTAGASFSASGAIALWVPFLGKVGVGAGGSGGGSKSIGYAVDGLLDIDSDGRPDLVWKEGEDLCAYLNDGGGFDTSVAYRCVGLDGDIDREESVSTFIGLSGNAGFIKGGSTWQESTTEAKTGWADIDGDGRVDFLKAGETHYLRNTGTAFVRQDFLSMPSGGGAPSLRNEDLYQRLYFKQEPLRKWEAPRSGVIRVEESAGLLDPGAASADGTVLRSYLRGSTAPFAAMELSTPASRASSTSSELAIGKDQALFFHQDVNADERGDDVEWNVKIRYLSIPFFEGLSEAADFLDPPATSIGRLPWNDRRLAAIYRASGSPAVVYRLKDDWRSADPSTLAEAHEALADHGLFRPRSISRSALNSVEGYGRSLRDVLAAYGTVSIVFDGRTIPLRADEVFLSCYSYDRDTDSYQRADEDPRLRSAFSVLDPILGDILDGDEFGSSFKRGLAYGEAWSGKKLPAGGTGEARAAAVNGGAVPLPARIDAGKLAGNAHPELGLLVGKTFGDDSEADPAETIWLKKTEGAWRLFRRRGGACEDASAEILGPVIESDDGVSVAFMEKGVKRTGRLSGKSYALDSVSDTAYRASLLPSVLAGRAYSADGVRAIPGPSWTTIYGACSQAERRALDAAYADGGGARTIRPEATQEQIAEAVRAILPFVRTGRNSIFDRFVAEEAGRYRIFTLEQDEYDRFIAFAGDDSSSWFRSLDLDPGEPEGTAYYLKTDLGDGDLAEIETAFRLYACGMEIFPHYERDSLRGMWNRKPEADADAVESAFRDAGLYAYTRWEESLRYDSNAVLPVARAILPAGSAIDPGFLNMGPAYPAGADVGLVEFPAFSEGGRIVIARSYLPVYDSAADHSIETEETPGDDELYSVVQPPDPLRGGIRGWYYGFWTGYYDWDERLLSADPNAGKAPTETARPPYAIGAESNLGAGAGARIEFEGRGMTPMEPSDLLGSPSGYDELSDSGLSSVHYDFAAYLRGDALHPERKGGDGFWRLPRTVPGGIAGGTLSGIRSSASEATDYNGGISVGFAGGTFNMNQGRSWQYAGLIDLNGDRYPDFLSFSDGEEGDLSPSVAYGTGSGFGAMTNVALRYPHFSEYANASYGFGASLSATSGSQEVKYDPKGRIREIHIIQPGNDNPNGSTALYGSKNGTYGVSSQTAGFMDMNGDGLPDQVMREGNGAFMVSLNAGPAGFGPARSWGGGCGQTVGLLESTLDGLSFSSTCSYGNSKGITGSAPMGSLMGTGELGLALNATANETDFVLSDVNGDGLQDQVAKLDGEGYFRVRLNLGDGFSARETPWYRPDWTVDRSGAGMLSGEIADELNAIQDALEIDLPLDWGIDRITDLADQAGNPLGGFGDPLKMRDTVGASNGFSFSLSGSVGATAIIGFVTLQGSIGANGCAANAKSFLDFVDIDGDGLPDHVLKLPGDDFLRVKRNLAGKAGLLKTIRLPQGGTVHIEYGHAGNTAALPQARYPLSRVTRDSGLPALAGDRGERSYAESFSFSGGAYDRVERVFLGYRRVASRKADGASVETLYNNYDFHLRGVPESVSVVADPEARNRTVLEATEYLTQKFLVGAYPGGESYSPRMIRETKRSYDPGSGNSLETRIAYEYDRGGRDGAYGNVTRYADYGSLATDEDDRITDIEYYLDRNAYIVGKPSCVRVSGAKGAAFRLRRASYGTRGELVEYGASPDGDTFLATCFTYDGYGNISSILNPGGSRKSYRYDDEHHAFRVRTIADNALKPGPAYQTSAAWDPRFAKPVRETDANGNSMLYAYDAFGRLAEVRSPYDTGRTPAASYSYRTRACPWSARAENKLRHESDDDGVLATVTLVDGLGRAIQTAKRGETRNEDGVRLVGWNVSGAIAYDAEGRAVSQGMLSFIPGEAEPGPAAMLRPTLTAYDELDRPISVALPDGATTRVDYGIESGQYLETETDPKGNISLRREDPRGDILGIERRDRNGKSLSNARYEYDPMGQLTKAMDAIDSAVSVSYDLLGRRTSLDSPDSGRKESFYDDSGNLVRETDADLRRRGQSIRYEYDTLDRLVRIDYPRGPDVLYEYGGPEAASANGAGRLLRRTDSSGSASFSYGKLGETLGVTRSIARLTPLAGEKTASIGYRWNYLGQLEGIVYPDGETLSYQYDRGGNILGATGTKYGRNTQYVKEIAYDEFGQRSYVEYANGVRTEYRYDENRRWLEAIDSADPLGAKIQDISYRFDEVGNVLGYSNDTSIYTVKQSYGYDDLYQLTSASGTFRHSSYGEIDQSSDYSQDFAYDAAGRMTGKTSSCSSKPGRSGGMELGYLLDYAYYPGSHRAERAGDVWYAYDGNGNVVEARKGGHSAEASFSGEVERDGDLRRTAYGFALVRAPREDDGAWKRVYEWDEENRLLRSSEGDAFVEYSYGADGQRAAKRSKNGETLYFDALFTMTTDYPDIRGSKHIYVGSTRVATRLYIEGDPGLGYEYENTYYYHSDHLGSASLVTDYEGKEYERIEYAPYGETWVEQTREGFDKIPYRFTGKELDPETDLYYYGARYLDPKTSIWISADPALAEYIPSAPANDESRNDNENLPGMGGVFNTVNMHLFHYAGNNPVKYVDPDGREGSFPRTPSETMTWLRQAGATPNQINTYYISLRTLMGTNGIDKSGPCYAMACLGIAQSYAGKNLTTAQVKKLLGDTSIYLNGNCGDPVYIISEGLKMLGVDVSLLDIVVSSKRSVDNLGKDSKAFATMRHVGTRNNPTVAGHWQEGKKDGTFKWDPINSIFDIGRKCFYGHDIFINKKDKNEEN